MLESRIGKALDRYIFDHLYERLTPFKEPGSLEAYFNKMSKDFDEDKDLLGITYGLYSAIDAKTSALLTHISILIAAVSIFYSNAVSGTFYRHLLGIELLWYLLATIVCLRCVRLSIPPVSETASHKIYDYVEIIKRRSMLLLASDMTIVATVALISILLGHAIL